MHQQNLSEATEASVADGPTKLEPKEKASRLEYIEQMVRQIRELAVPLQEPMVLYLLEMAYAEIFDLRNQLADELSMHDDLASEAHSET